MGYREREGGRLRKREMGKIKRVIYTEDDTGKEGKQVTEKWKCSDIKTQRRQEQEQNKTTTWCID